MEAAAMQAAAPVGSTVVDIGTHIGTMMMAFAEKVGSSGLVIGIEAQRNLASMAAKNAALNGHTHVHIINAAIDSSTRTCLVAVASHTNEDITNFGFNNFFKCLAFLERCIKYCNNFIGNIRACFH